MIIIKLAINKIYTWNAQHYFSQEIMLLKTAQIMQHFQGEMLLGGLEKEASQSCFLVRQNWMHLGD